MNKSIESMIELVINNIEINYAHPEMKIVVQNTESCGRLFFIYSGKFEVLIMQYGSKDG